MKIFLLLGLVFCDTISILSPQENEIITTSTVNVNYNINRNGMVLFESTRVNLRDYVGNIITSVDTVKYNNISINMLLPYYEGNFIITITGINVHYKVVYTIHISNKITSETTTIDETTILNVSTNVSRVHTSTSIHTSVPTISYKTNSSYNSGYNCFVLFTFYMIFLIFK